MSNSIEIAQLTKRYGDLSALDSLSLTIPEGHIVGLMGENGSGKTTLLKILSGVMLDYSGTALVGGKRPGLLTKAQVSYLPDTEFLSPRLNAGQVIDMYSDFFADFDVEKAWAKLDFFGVPTNRPAHALSKGQREKMQVAMVMARNARFFFLDEPLSGVDPAARDQILRGILTDLPEDALMIISTHLIQDIESIVSYAVFLHAGSVRVAGGADELRATHGTSLDSLFREMYKWHAN